MDTGRCQNILSLGRGATGGWSRPFKDKIQRKSQKQTHVLTPAVVILNIRVT